MFPYVGGKGKLGKRIIECIRQHVSDKLPYVEPFVGAGHSVLEMKRVCPERECWAADNDPTLIHTLQSMKKDDFNDTLPCCTEKMTTEIYDAYRDECKRWARGE